MAQSYGSSQGGGGSISAKLTGGFVLIAIAAPAVGIITALTLGQSAATSGPWLSIGLSALIGVGLALGMARYFSDKLTHPLKEMADVTNAAAAGNLLNGDLMHQKYGSDDEIGQLAQGLSNLINKVNALVSNVDLMSEQMTNSAVQLAEATEQTGHATTQVAQTIQQVSIGAQDQSAQLSNAATEVERLFAQSSTLQAESQETLQVMATLKDQFQTTAERVRTLGARSSQIGQIVQTIEEIADQTNLLALNAAIEAARAGDHGRGFAVVADEVRKLAERSASATKEISNIIRETQNETTLAVTAMEQGVSQVEIGVDRAARAEQKAQAMADSAHKVNDAIASVAGVSEENSAAAEEVSSATEEMTAQVEEAVASSHTFKSLSLQLREAVNGFNYQSTQNTKRASYAGTGVPKLKVVSRKSA